MEYREVHIGRMIELFLTEHRITRTELGRRIGMAQPHISRLLLSKSMNTEKLQRICVALDYDFFQYYRTQSMDEETRTRIAYVKGKKEGYEEAIAILEGKEEKKKKETA